VTLFSSQGIRSDALFHGPSIPMADATSMHYTAPLNDFMFNLTHLARLDEVSKMSGYEEAGLETAQAVLAECARFVQEVVAPLNVVGDRSPSAFHDGSVATTPGFKQAFAQFAAAGWQGLQHPEAFGGQGLPKCIAAACAEMLNSANMSFALCPMLTDGAIEALLTAASPALQASYLTPLVEGRWTGTMNLTEPQAGSDLAQVRTRAEPQADGSFKVFGTKIFITYGEHDMAENIVHLVLARVQGAPEGVKGISLFVVPKFLVQSDGTLGERNDVQCVSIEHKLGIKASPTAVLQFGDGLAHSVAGAAGAGAVGYLVGEQNRGLEYMFIMMNAARYAVGVQGVALAERAYQQAVGYARDRVQSRPVDGSSSAGATIIHHPDVRRMLMRMRALTEGCRAVAAVAAAACDTAHRHTDAELRQQQQSFYEFLVPLVKGYGTEMAQEVASMGVQVHGGMGFIEETGAAQHYRDAKILSIYEGTTAIQANDFVGRKTLRDAGATARTVAARIEATEADLRVSGSEDAQVVAAHLGAARVAFLEAVQFVVDAGRADPNTVYAGSVPYLLLAGNLIAGWQLANALLVAHRLAAAGQDQAFMQAKVVTARFYAEHILIQAPGMGASIVGGGRSVMALPIEAF
jgi:alkylation response protein AidB-like acyl-CoA dehydrogenase